MTNQHTMGMLLITTGGVLLSIVAAYYAYGAFQKTQYDKFQFETARPGIPLNSEPGTMVTSETTVKLPSPKIEQGISRELSNGQQRAQNQSSTDPLLTKVVATPIISPSVDKPKMPPPATSTEGPPVSATFNNQGQSLGTTSAMDTLQAPSGIGDPDTAYRPPSPLERIRNNTGSYSLPDYAKTLNNSSPPTNINIPSISIDSSVKELTVKYLDESYSWETPKHTVGHIPTTALPGTQGQGWYFGHLESPISGEGNVFFRLPEIPALLKGGQVVIVELESKANKYIYQVYKTEVINEHDLVVTNSGHSDITLVACWPRFVYDHRILVTAALVGIEKLSDSGPKS